MAIALTFQLTPVRTAAQFNGARPPLLDSSVWRYESASCLHPLRGAHADRQVRWVVGFVNRR